MYKVASEQVVHFPVDDEKRILVNVATEGYLGLEVTEDIPERTSIDGTDLAEDRFEREVAHISLVVRFA